MTRIHPSKFCTRKVDAHQDVLTHVLLKIPKSIG